MEHPLGSATHQGETGVECADVSMWRIGRVAPTYRYSHWKNSVRPVCEYACELWEGEISATWVTKLETIQYSVGKAALGLHANPVAVGVRRSLGCRN